MRRNLRPSEEKQQERQERREERQERREERREERQERREERRRLQDAEILTRAEGRKLTPRGVVVIALGVVRDVEAVIGAGNGSEKRAEAARRIAARIEIKGWTEEQEIEAIGHVIDSVVTLINLGHFAWRVRR